MKSQCFPLDNNVAVGPDGVSYGVVAAAGELPRPLPEGWETFPDHDEFAAQGIFEYLAPSTDPIFPHLPEGA